MTRHEQTIDNPTNRLRSLRVGDVMNRDVVCVSANATMAGAAKLLAEHGISGMPVVDEFGRCVGILSAHDVAKRARPQRNQTSQLRGPDFHLEFDPEQAALVVGEISEDRVGAHMAPAVQSIHPDASLMDAARCMAAARIHRLVVLNGDARPVGVISVLDVITALVGEFDGSGKIAAT